MAAGPAGNDIATLNEWLAARKWLLWEKGLNFLYDELKNLFAATPLNSTLGAQNLSAQTPAQTPIGNVSSQYNFKAAGASTLVEPPTKFRP